MLKAIRPVQTNFEMMFEWAILSMSVIFIILGIGGLIMIITTYGQETDAVLNYAYAFVYTYMLALGIFLLAYRKRILIKK